MSKNIPKPIIRIGFSTKKNGEMSFEIDGNKIKNLAPTQFLELISQVDEAKKKIMFNRSGMPVGDKMLNELQYDEIVTFLQENKKLAAIKAYKEFTGIGLKESKDAIDGLHRKLKLKL